MEQSAIHLKQARVFQKHGQYRAALIESRNAARLTPFEIDVYLQMISLYNELGYYRSTLDLIDRLNQPDNLELILPKANAFNGVKKHRSAYQLLRKFANNTLDEQQSSYYQLHLGEALTGMGKLDDGRLSFQKASAGAAHDSALLGIARIEALSGNSQAAMAVIEQLLEKNPANTGALILAGEIANYAKDYDSAEDYFSTALSHLPRTDIMLPERLKTLQMLSRVLTMQNRSHEALIYKRILAEQSPEYVLSRDRIQRNIQLIEEGKLEEAEDDLLDMLEKGGDRYAGTLLGIVNYMQGDLNEASELLSAHLDPETANTQALELLVSAKFQLDEIDQVLAILGPEIQARTDNAQLVGLYGLAMLAKQDMEGIKYVNRSLELEPDNSRLRLALVSFYQEQQQQEHALEQARLAYTYDESSPMVQGALIQQLIGADRTLEAQQLASEIGQSNPEDSNSLTLAGLTFSSTGQIEKATAYLEKAVEQNPENATAWLALARIAFKDQDFNTAETYYLNTLKLLPDNIGAYKGYISTFEARGKVDQALKALSFMTAFSNSNNGVPLAVMAESYLRDNELDLALKNIGEALHLQANNSYIERVAITVYARSTQQALRDKDIKGARKQLSQGLSYVPNAVPLLELLARLEAMDQNPEAARETIASLKQLEPAVAYEVEGDLAREGDKKAALKAYHSAWALQPTSPLARKIYLLSVELDSKLAAEFKRDWSKQLVDDPGLYFATATEAQHKNDRKTARKAYQALLIHEPGNVTALNNLAWLYLIDKDNRALELAQHAAQLSPDNPAVLDTYGMVLVENGQTDEGIALLEKALLLDPGSEDIKSHLHQAQND